MSVVAERFVWVDVVKTFAILLVVFGHVWRGLFEVQDMQIDASLFSMIDNGIYSFHMPLFFIVSGFLFFGSYQKGWVELLKKQALYIIWPYFLWSFIIVCMKIVMSGHVNDAYGFERLAQILYAPVSIFWFLYVLFVAQIFTKFLYEKIHSSGLLFLISVFLLSSGLIINLSEIPILSFVSQYLIFFVIGFILAQKDLLKNEFHQIKGVIFAALLFCAGQLVVFYFYNNFSPVIYAFVGTILSVSLIVVCTYFVKLKLFQSSFFYYISASTLAIYVSHTIFTAGTRFALFQANISDVYIHIVAGVLLGFSLPLIGYEISKKMKLNLLAGLGPSNIKREK